MKLLSKKTVLILFLTVFILSGASTKKAEAWFGQEAMIRTMLDTMMENVKGGVVGGMKQAAIAAVSSNVLDDDEKIVTNFREHVLDDPDDNTAKFADDLVSKTTGGRGGSGYEGFGGNLSKELAKIGKAATSEKKTPKVDFEGDPSNMFSQEDGFKRLGDFTNTSKINHPALYERFIIEEVQEKKEDERSLASTETQANQGYTVGGDTENVTEAASDRRLYVADVNAAKLDSLVNSIEMSEVIVNMVAVMAQS